MEKEASGLSKKSIKNYKDVYDRYTRDVGQPISKNSVNNWIHLLLERGMNPISINYYINQIRVFSYWLIENNYIESFTIRKIKTQEPQIKTIPEQDVLILLNKPKLKSSFVTYRTWTIINFILATGARASTILNIKIDDVDFSTKEIRYTHLKNKTSAIVPLSFSLERVLRQYINCWDVGSGYLFLDKYGGQLTVTALSHSLHNYCVSRGVKPRSAHAFRHTFAKKYVTNGGNVFALQKMLTHTDLAMTRKYIHLFSSDLKRGYEDICPLDSYKKNTMIIKK